MTAGEYILSLLAIISALSVGELVFGLHTLLDHRTKIAWDWLALVAALHVFIVVLFAFWVSWGAWHTSDRPVTFIEFLLPTSQLVCYFLAARTVLPRADDAVDGRIDLRDHYARARPLLWGALATNSALVLVSLGLREFALNETNAIIPGQWVSVGAGLVLGLLLAANSSRRVHVVVVPFVAIATIALVAPAFLQ